MNAALLALTDFSEDALRILRDGGRFQWHTVTFIAFVLYVYAQEIERRNWDAVLAGVALWLMDWVNEIANALVLHFTDRAAIWTTTGSTSFLILIGLTIEISFMFAVAGVIFVKCLPADRGLKILGLPNRWLAVLSWSCFAVFVEVLLSRTGYFHWEYWWWNWPFVPLIVVFGYGTFFAMAAWVYDTDDRRKQLRIVGGLAAVVVVALVLFGPVLGWI